MAFVGAGVDDLGYLSSRVAELVVRVEEVWAKADACVRPEIADDLARAELAVDGLGLGSPDDDRAAPAIGVARAQHLEAGRVERRHVRGSGQKPGRAFGVVLLGLERERARVRLPAREGRLQPFGEIGADVEPAGARATTEPLDAAADGEVDPKRGDVQRNRARRLVGVEHDERAGFVRPLNDRLDVLDLAGLEEDVADWDEQCPLVDRLEHGGLVGDDLDVRASPSLRLVEVANRRKLALAVDDAVARRLELEAREHDRLRDGDVLVHRHRPRRGADDAAQEVPDRGRGLPPAFRPGPNAALPPLARVAKQPLLRADGHRAQRMVDQIGRVLEDRKAVAVALERLHRSRAPRATRPVQSVLDAEVAWNRRAPPRRAGSPSRPRSRRRGCAAAARRSSLRLRARRRYGGIERRSDGPRPRSTPARPGRA